MTDFRELVPDKKIAYVFATPNISVGLHGSCADTDSAGNFPSDHLPLLATVRLPSD